MVDEQEVVKGIVSLSDILQALVLTDDHCGKFSHMAVQVCVYNRFIIRVLLKKKMLYCFYFLSTA